MCLSYSGDKYDLHFKPKHFSFLFNVPQVKSLEFTLTLSEIHLTSSFAEKLFGIFILFISSIHFFSGHEKMFMSRSFPIIHTQPNLRRYALYERVRK